MSLNWKSPVGGGCCDNCGADICDQKPVVTSSSTYSHIGCNVSYAITAIHSPTSFSATGLPSGLSCNSGTGVISGSVASPFTGNVTVNAINACGTGSLIVVFTLSNPVATPVITSPNTATGTGCLVFSYNITATNSPTSYGVSGLPSGLSVNTTTGAITGRVRSSWSGTVTVSATNACGTGSLGVGITIDAPSIPSPTLACDTIASSKSKCGWPEYSGHESSPPKYYTSQAWSFGGSHAYAYGEYGSVNCGGSYTFLGLLDLGGTSTYNRSTCAITAGNTWYETQNGSYSSSGTTGSTLEAYMTGSAYNDGATPSVTSNTWTLTDSGTCHYGGGTLWFNAVGTATETLGSEYTTAILISDTEALLPSYPNTWMGANAATRDLSSDEITYSIQRFKYKFILPDLTGFDCYKITWNEGGTPMSYVWDGIATETGVYGPVIEPGTNGTIDVNSISVSCSCS